MKFILLLSFALCCALGTASAQPANPDADMEGPDSERQAERRSIRFYCMGENLPQVFFEPRNNQEIQIRGATGSLSAPYPMPTDRQLAIYRKIQPPPAAPAGTKPARQILASVKIPSGCAKAIVLLFPAGDVKTGTLRAVVFEDSYQRHPRQSVRLFNLSAAEVGLKLGGERMSVLPAQNGVLRWTAGQENVISWQIASHKGDSWVLASAQERAVRPNLRAFMFAYTADVGSEGGPELCVNMFFDWVPDK